MSVAALRRASLPAWLCTTTEGFCAQVGRTEATVLMAFVFLNGLDVSWRRRHDEQGQDHQAAADRQWSKATELLLFV